MSRPAAARAARWQDALAGLCGAGLAAVVYGPRLPQSTEMLLPRRPGFTLFSWAIAAWADPLWAAGLSWLAVAAGLGALGVLAWRLAARRRQASPKGKHRPRAWRVAAAAGGVLVALLLARQAAAGLAAVLERLCFPAEALDWREPAALAAGFAFLFVVAFRAGGGFASWALEDNGASTTRWPRWTAVLFCAASAGAGARIWASAVESGPARDAGARRLVVVLSSEDRDQAQREVEVPAAPPDSPRGFDGLRLLYESRTLDMDASGLREALRQGTLRGDPLARALLLDNLQVAPDGEQTRALLALLSDESRWRVGPRAAAELAAAYARLGDESSSRRWQARASQGPGSVAPGLLALPAASAALRRGRIVGRLRVPAPARIALYARREAGEPALLGPDQLVASQVLPVGGGGFSFDGLGEGSYYLAFAVDLDSGARPGAGRLEVRGEPGELVLSRRRPEIGVWLDTRPVRD